MNQFATNIIIYTILCVLSTCPEIHVLKTGMKSILDKNRQNESVVNILTRMGSFNGEKIWETQYRIPSDTIPTHYDLYLFPDLQNSSFTGRVTIHFNVQADRHFVLAHVKYLRVTKTLLFQKIEEGGTNDDRLMTLLQDPFEYKPNEFWVVIPNEELKCGSRYKLYMEFEGSLNNGIVGFYKSVYTVDSSSSSTISDSHPKLHEIATSKFQPTFARRAFPCFDEPSFKTTFSVTLVRPTTPGYIALSNMLPHSQSPPDTPRPGFVEITFEKSVPMVTYLVIFIVCDFEYLEKRTDIYQTRFRVYGTTNQKHRLQYALDFGACVTDFFAFYFNVSYPLSKLDMAAIPDYSSGATEHWGLITYRETNLIFDDLVSSTNNKVKIASVIAHELVHQWFGNLVTLEWWNDLWLNEGFATYMQWKGVKHFEPDWDTETMFLTNSMHPVLDLDATMSSHAIVVKVDNPDEINSVFDAISYYKGSSVIRMIEDFMGSADFRSGVTLFLKRFSYQNAVTADLFDVLSEASSEHLNIKKIVSTWTEQKGYPLLTLSKSVEGTYYRITQERFLTDSTLYNSQNETEDSKFNYRWEVPLTYITSNNATKSLVWFPAASKEIVVNVPDNVSWVKFNVAQKGFYRVNYPEYDWQKFSVLLRESVDFNLSTSDRTNLLNDAFALAKASRISYKIPLELTLYLSRERELGPWETTIGEMKYFIGIFYFTDIYPAMVTYQRNLIFDLVNELGWSDTGDLKTRLLRPIILNLACSLGLAGAQKYAANLFNDWRKLGKPVVPNLRSIVYRYGLMAHYSDESVWDWMLQRYIAENNAQEKAKLLQSLCSVRDPGRIHRFIQMAKNTSIVREQDFFTMISLLSSNRMGEFVVWDFFRNEWEYLVDRFTLNNRLMGRIISQITAKFSSQVRLEEMRSHFKQYPEAGAGENYRKIALETVVNNINFLKKHSGTIARWLNDNQNITNKNRTTSLD